MVGCVHIANAVRIASIDTDQLKIIDDPSRLSKSYSSNQKEDYNGRTKSNWNCVSCGSSQSPWLCLSCGLIHCGRYVNGDGIRHHKAYSEHSVTMDCHSYAVFCYACDDFVADDTIDRKVHSVRNSLKYHNSTRRSDHCYSSGYQRPGYEIMSDIDTDSNLDEGTEEEDMQSDDVDVRIRPNSEKDEEGSVLEYSPPEKDDSEIVGGRMLRSRKRKLPHLDNDAVCVRIVQPANKNCNIPVKGLRNLGNTCFMNAVLQALNSVDIFREFLINLPLLETEEKKVRSSPRYKTRRHVQLAGPDNDNGLASSILAEELRKTMIELASTNSDSPISPNSLFGAVWGMCSRFAGFHQQDSHEFLRLTLDRLHNELRQCRIPDSSASRVATSCGVDYSPTSSAVSLIFEGALQSQVTCISCRMTSNKQDPFLDLSLDVYVPSAVQKGTSVSLTDCIKRFFEKEELEQCEQYMCGSCQERRPSTKQLFLRCLPKVLCLHLKRFRWTQTSRGKVDNMVDFPLKGLDLTSFISSSAQNRRGRDAGIYDLSAIVVHHGSGMGGGHYTAYGLRDKEWHHFNDSTVRPSNCDVVLKQKAYLLFYTRVH